MWPLWNLWEDSMRVATDRLGRVLGFAVIAALMAIAAPAGATIVNSLPTLSGAPVPGTWYNTSAAGGTASIETLTGVGGALENDQPLPADAGRLTTGFAVPDRGRVETFADFGDATTVLTTGSLSYSYYKEAVPGGSMFAAPALQLSLAAPGHSSTNDNFGTLVYEPTWNQGTGGSSAVPTGVWFTDSISASTGEGPTGDGGWWWTGGFEQPNTAGGPPNRSLAEWAALFAADPDFANARVVSLGVNVGTNNLGVDSYFDDVRFSVPGDFDLAFDFSAIPEPTFATWFGVIGLTLAGRANRCR